MLCLPTLNIFRTSTQINWLFQGLWTNWVFLIAIGFVDIELWDMSQFVFVVCVCVCVCVCMCMCARMGARMCVLITKILWVLILKPVLRRGMRVIQVSHGIVLPAKLHYRSWGDGVGNNVFPNQVLNGELNTCDVSMVQTRQAPQSEVSWFVQHQFRKCDFKTINLLQNIIITSHYHRTAVKIK